MPPLIKVFNLFYYIFCKCTMEIFFFGTKYKKRMGKLCNTARIWINCIRERRKLLVQGILLFQKTADPFFQCRGQGLFPSDDVGGGLLSLTEDLKIGIEAAQTE